MARKRTAAQQKAFEDAQQEVCVELIEKLKSLYPNNLEYTFYHGVNAAIGIVSAQLVFNVIPDATLDIQMEDTNV